LKLSWRFGDEGHRGDYGRIPW